MDTKKESRATVVKFPFYNPDKSRVRSLINNIIFIN